MKKKEKKRLVKKCYKKSSAIEAKQKLKKEKTKPWTQKAALRPSSVLLVSKTC